MKKYVKLFPLFLLTLLLTTCAVSAAAWGNTYAKYPTIFKLNGKEYAFPCKLQDFLRDDWFFFDGPTRDQMACYEILDGFDEGEFILEKNNQEFNIILRNHMAYEQEMQYCDVVSITVSDYSFLRYDAPDIEIFGIRPGMSRKNLPKWLQKQRDFSSDGVEYHVFSSFDDSMLAMFEKKNNYAGSIYYSCDDADRIQYFSIDIEYL